MNALQTPIDLLSIDYASGIDEQTYLFLTIYNWVAVQISMRTLFICLC